MISSEEQELEKYILALTSSKLERENISGFWPKHEILHRSFSTAIPAAGTFVLNNYK